MIFDFFNYILLDIIAIENTAVASRNIFKELNNLYLKLAKVRPECFLKNFKNSTGDRKANLKDFNMSLCLLPHQIFILPLDYKSALSEDFLSDFLIIGDEYLR